MKIRRRLDFRNWRILTRLLKLVERVRQAAAIILGHVDTPETQQMLVHFLTDPSPQVRDAAIEALVSIGKPAIPSVFPALDSTDSQLRKMAAIALSRIDRERFCTHVISHINDNLRVIYHNHSRIQALSPCKQYASISVLQSMLMEQNDQLIDEIFGLLAAIHDKETVKAIAESLHSESAHVRASAAKALESLTSSQIVGLIAPLFDPELPPARLLQIGAYTWGLHHPDAAGVIRQVATDPDEPLFRAIMTFTLGEMGTALAPQLGRPGHGGERGKVSHPTLTDRPTGTTDTTDDTVRPGKRRSLRSRMAGLFQKMTDATEDVTSQPTERGERPVHHPPSADILDRLITVPEDISPQASEQEDYRAHSAQPAELLDRLLDASENIPARPDREARTTARSNAHDRPVLSLEEIEAMLEPALADPVPDVRAAARAAKRMIAGVRVTDVASETETVLSTIERIIFLKQAVFFQGMTMDQLRVLATVCEEGLFPKDTKIFDQGDPGGAMYVVVSGRVAIESPDQHRVFVTRLATMEAHSCFGEISLFDDSPRSAAARAMQDTMTLRLRREPLVVLVRQYPDLGVELISVLSQYLRDANDRIADPLSRKWT